MELLGILIGIIGLVLGVMFWLIEPQRILRWIRGRYNSVGSGLKLPDGIREIRTAFGQPNSFKQFLSEDSLRYFSRDEFASLADSGYVAFSEKVVHDALTL